MSSIDANMKADAIQMLKAGWAGDAVVQALIQRGAERAEGQAYVAELIRLKREAEVAARHASCGRCGSPIDRRSAFLDPSGTPICNNCQRLVDANAAQYRAELSLQEAQGVPAWMLQQARPAAGEPPRICPKCRTPTAVHVGTKQYVRGGIPDGREFRYACATCSDEFTIDSLYRLVSYGVGACIAGPIGWWLIVDALRSGNAISGQAVVGLALGLGPLFPLWEIVKRVRHPVATRKR